MRLLVDVEVAAKRGNEIQSFETTVWSVSRSYKNGIPSEETVLVLAYIPPHHRRSIIAPVHAWETPELLWCSARVKFNRHTLRDFMLSGDRKWTFQEVK